MRPHYNTVFISDVHLGSRSCQASTLLHFLDHATFDTIYLVGDIIDMWAMSKQFRWPEAHNNVMHKLISLSHLGVKVIYVPGNHDAPIQKYDGLNFGDIEIHREIIHTTADGMKLLVLHGDQFDSEVTLGRFEAFVGDKGYELLLYLNRMLNQLRSLRKQNYWSLAGWLKKHIKSANDAIARYRRATTKAAAARGLDGVICGHIHHPEMTTENGVRYLNTGDWIENCFAIVEHQNGQLELIDYLVQQNQNVVKVHKSGKIKTLNVA